MSIQTTPIPKLRSIGGGIEALGEFFIPQGKRIIEDSTNLVLAILGLQKLSEKLFLEYARLYNVRQISATIPLISSADHAGFDSLVCMRPDIGGIGGKIRSLSEETIERNIEKIGGIQPNITLPVIKKWIQVRFKCFQIFNKGLGREFIGFADPDIQFQRGKYQYSSNFSSRLEQSLDPSNTLIQLYPDFLEEIEKAIWHEIIFIMTISSDVDLFCDPILGLNLTGYGVGEESLSCLIKKYRRKYFQQFCIHRARTILVGRIFE